MRKMTFQLFIWPSIAWIILQMSGCTLIGMGIGSIDDAQIPPKKTIRRNWGEFINIGPGNEVCLEFKDGCLINGIITGFKPVPSIEYATKYAASREQEKDTRLPSIGENLTISMMGGSQRDIEFLGFDLTEEGQVSVLTRPRGKGTSPKVPLAFIREIRPQNGDALDLDRINGLLTTGQIPFSSGIGISVKRGDNISNDIFPLPEIKQIEVTKDKKGWLIGLLIGGVIDIIFISKFKGFPNMNFGSHFY